VAIRSFGIVALVTVSQFAWAAQDWELVNTVNNPYGGTEHHVLIPELKQRDTAYYEQIGNAVCGDRNTCMISFWIDRSRIPSSPDTPVKDFPAQTAKYERHPNYKLPHLSLSCWLYPNREIAEAMKCSYLPGAKVPWEMPNPEAPWRK
jgi:hypothetical protein